MSPLSKILYKTNIPAAGGDKSYKEGAVSNKQLTLLNHKLLS